MRLLLIRHGRTRANQDGVLDTAPPGPALTPAGRRQAAALVDALAGEDIGALYVSPLTRARMTAAPLSAALARQAVVRAGLREVEAGALEGSTAPEDIGRYAAVAAAWAAGRTGVPMPGAPSGAAFFRRFDGVVAEAAGCGAEVVALVTHGTAVRVWTAARTANVSVDFVLEHEVSNTGVVAVEGTPETGWHTVSWCGTALTTDALSGTGGA
ncbi:histidine phosphatase family protein [Streptomyces fumanus]|nr:histidine phosphatase family protein [Streptomyces fumanus]